MKTTLSILILFFILSACSVGKSSLAGYKKYSRDQLQKDYSIYQSLLEDYHPGLYWYVPKDSMDHYFAVGKAMLKDSMNERGFRNVLNYVTSKIDCGHTSVRSSRAWNKWVDSVSLSHIFPLSIKVWPDTMVVAANLNRKDSVLTRGTVITSVNGKTIPYLTDTLFNFLSADGYNLTHKYQTLSNRGFFGSLYTAVFGLSDQYTIEYLDSTNHVKKVIAPAYNPGKDSIFRKRLRAITQEPKPSRKERKLQELNNVRLLKIDTISKTAMMDLSSFGRGYGLRGFFRNSFRTLQQNKISYLVIDVRGNGGGSVTNSTLITKYIADHPFKVADSLYAVRKKSRYQRYIHNNFWNKLFITVFTTRKKDGYYHFRYFEKHQFKPKKINHFDGKVYILTGGNSFSATTLFVTALKKQENVFLVGEETGGGAYGNSAWLIPDVTLPVTKVRFRLPLFRLVIDKNIPKNGRGVQPDFEAKPTVDSIRRNIDFKLAKAMELIQKDKELNPD
jgi:hypothetical protein